VDGSFPASRAAMTDEDLSIKEREKER